MGARKEFDITPQIDPDGIATSQTLSGGGVQNFTLDGAFATSGVASFTDAAHIVEIVSVGNDSGLTFTVTGTDPRDVTISEAITGANAGTASTTKQFKTITQVASTGDTAAAVTIGTSGLAVSNWCLFNQGENINVGFSSELSSGASMTYSAEFTFQDLQQNSDIAITTQDHDDISGKTVNSAGNFGFAASAFRLNVTAFTSGTIKLIVWQSY